MSLLACANIAFHLGPQFPQASALGHRVALSARPLLIALIGGRVTRSFTRNWLAQQSREGLPATVGRLDQFALVLTGVSVTAWIVAPDQPVSGLLVAAAGLATLARLARWRGLRTFAE